ncbi:MAG: rod shape-determining protein MreD [Alphaproteobacteria bacterium]
MKSGGLWQRLDRFGRNLIPLAITLTLALIGALPMPIAGYAAVVPLFTFCAVFFWAVYRPDLLPPWLVLLIGLVQDALAGTPFGLNAIMLLLAYGMVASQRRFFLSRPFPLVWGGFMLIALIAIVVAWLLASIFVSHIIRPGPATFQLLLTLALYPLVTLLMAGAQRLLPQPA